MSLLQAEGGVPVVPDNNVNITGGLNSGSFLIYVGVTGDVSVDTVRGNTALIFKNFTQGQILPVMVRRVRSTGTTATDMVALEL